MVNAMMATIATLAQTVSQDDRDLKMLEDVIGNSAIVVGPVEAQQILDEWRYEWQRPLKPDTVKEYARLMRRGEFWSASEIVVAHAPDDNGLVRGFLIDGQHRLNAVIEAGIAQVLTIKHVRAKDMLEVGSRYASIDIQSRRTTRDHTRSMRLDERWSMTPTECVKLQQAAFFIQNGFKSKGNETYSPAQRIDFADGYAPAMRVMIDYISGGIFALTRGLRMRGPLGVALVTIREGRQVHGAARVEDFWRGVALDDGLAATDPRKHAVRHLYEMAQRSTSKTLSFTQEHSSRAIALCFNNYIYGREMKVLRVVESRAPMVIAGTSWPRVEKEGKDGEG